ncbi:MAG: hypothetical protein B7Z60_09325, partial [Ferrovum sp. 37-45-19]
NIDKKPLTLVFDEIILKSKNTSNSTKNHLQNLIVELTMSYRNPRLDSIFYCLTKNILTTNYSMCHILDFDRVDAPFLSKNVPLENTFSIFRHYELPRNGRKLWYINGNSFRSTSITLGHLQYARYLSQINKYLTTGLTYSKEKLLRTPLSSNKLDFDFDKNSTIYSWVDIFLRDDIHIVGLTMDYTESILWWLLTEKLYLRKKHPKNIGNVTYYQINIHNNKISDEETNKLNMLSDLGVIVKNIETDSYLNGYLDIATMFDKRSKDRYLNYKPLF